MRKHINNANTCEHIGAHLFEQGLRCVTYSFMSNAISANIYLYPLEMWRITWRAHIRAQRTFVWPGGEKCLPLPTLCVLNHQSVTLGLRQVTSTLTRAHSRKGHSQKYWYIDMKWMIYKFYIDYKLYFLLSAASMKSFLTKGSPNGASPQRAKGTAFSK